MVAEEEKEDEEKEDEEKKDEVMASKILREKFLSQRSRAGIEGVKEKVKERYRRCNKESSGRTEKFKIR